MWSGKLDAKMNPPQEDFLDFLERCFVSQLPGNFFGYNNMLINQKNVVVNLSTFQ